MSEKRKKGSVYPVKLKKQAIDLYYKGFGRTDIAKELNIYNKKLVNEWVRKYEKEGFSGLEDRRGLARGGNKGRPRKKPLTLEEENERLKIEVAYLKKLIAQKRGC
ncbi:transposase [Alteribacillus sp. JSM 102045]|uniref:transposase n=1 Tax=Alteribacillus sp. JSM 102045 TaxID=1562101 RepID=UPI0035BFFE0D